MQAEARNRIDQAIVPAVGSDWFDRPVKSLQSLLVLPYPRVRAYADQSPAILITDSQTEARPDTGTSSDQTGRPYDELEDSSYRPNLDTGYQDTN